MAKSVELPNGGDGWLLTDSEYKRLLERDRELGLLEAAGVDNWSGIDYAYELMQEDEDGQGNCRVRD